MCMRHIVMQMNKTHYPTARHRVQIIPERVIIH